MMITAGYLAQKLGQSLWPKMAPISSQGHQRLVTKLISIYKAPQCSWDTMKKKMVADFEER